MLTYKDPAQTPTFDVLVQVQAEKTQVLTSPF